MTKRGLLLVEHVGDTAGADDRCCGRQRLVQHDGLLAVYQHRRVELAQLGHRRVGASGAAAEHNGHGGKRLLGDTVGVFGGELQLETRGVRNTCADAKGVQQAVLGVPTAFLRVAFGACGIGVDRHVLSQRSLNESDGRCRGTLLQLRCAICAARPVRPRDGEVEEVRHEDARHQRRIGAAGLQDVETLHDENVGLFDDYLVVGQDVIDRVRVDGSNRPRLAALHGATGSGVPDLSPRHCGRCGIGSTIPKGVNGYSSQAFAQLGAIIGSTVREHHRAVSRVGMTQQKCPKSAVVAAMAEVLSGTTLLLYEHAQCFVHHLRRELRREKLTVVVAASVQHGRQDKQQILGGAEEPASRRPRGQFVATGDGLALVVVARRKFPLGRRCELEGGRCGAQRREDGLVEEVGERLTGGLLHQMLQHQIAGAGVGEPFARHGGQHDRAEVSVTGPRLAHRGNRCAGLVDEPLGTAATWFGQEGAVGLVGRGTPSHHTSAVLQK
ncbi:hypothetical protein GQR58_030039 [Nymphon striatum]|nr:hypothetical protein GQR58_030039 [Nymphon striatum]